MIRRIIVATVAMACFGRLPVARAQDASAWDGQFHAAARVIAGAAGRTADTKWLRAGIEIRLDPGWKTYWRYPGDSGVPPTFDFTGSENVQSITILWPAPERFADGAGGQSIGYLGDVVLPLHVVPKDANKSALLRVKLGYAVCGNLCVPAQAELDITLSGKGGAEDSMLVAAEGRVPRPIRLGSHDQTGRGLTVQSVRREVDGTHARVVVEVAAPEGEQVDLFAEGPTPDWALPLPQPTKSADSAPGMRRFIFDLDGLPPGAKADGATLRLTAISSTDAVEVEARLD
jgi:DsbC/DsbD-like thiol-disulfide interchange protein